MPMSIKMSSGFVEVSCTDVFANPMKGIENTQKKFI